MSLFGKHFTPDKDTIDLLCNIVICVRMVIRFLLQCSVYYSWTDSGVFVLQRNANGV